LQNTKKRERGGSSTLRVSGMRYARDDELRRQDVRATIRVERIELSKTVIDVVISAGHVVRTARSKGTSP
jgi:hypothetical protein